MGKKRKFVNPDESDNSEYEWVEQSTSSKSVENIKEKPKTRDELSEFWNLYSTKSTSEMRSDKIAKKKKDNDVIYEDRLYKAEVNENNSDFDDNWLRKSYHRCLEQANSEDKPVEQILAMRYDDKTIDYILKKFGSSSRHNSNYSKRNYMANTTQESTSTEQPEESKQIEQRYVTNQDLNDASAAVFRAERSNDVKKIDKMKKKLETLREAMRRNLKVKFTKTSKTSTEPQHETVKKSLKSGKFVPYLEHSSKFQSTSTSYNSNLRQLEGLCDGDDMRDEFVRISSKIHKINDHDDEGEYDSKCADPGVRKEKDKAISHHKNQQKYIKNCLLCYNNLKKHLILTKGDNFFVIVPLQGCLVPNHCVILPRDHIASVARMDDNLYEELQQFKARIAKFHMQEFDCDTVFMESVGNLDRFPHCSIDCVPVSKVAATDMASSPSLYFRKSIQDAKSEWCVNRGLLEYRKGDIRRTVPAEMRYFSVDFSNFDKNPGLAFIVEKAYEFRSDFGLSVCADMLGLDEIQVRQKNKINSDFKVLSGMILQLEKKWRKYGEDLKSMEESD